MEDYNIDSVTDFAAEGHVDRSFDTPDDFVNTNVIGTYSPLKAAKTESRDCGARAPHRFHHVATNEGCGSFWLDDPAFAGSTRYPLNLVSKAGSDHRVGADHHPFGPQRMNSQQAGTRSARNVRQALDGSPRMMPGARRLLASIAELITDSRRASAGSGGFLRRRGYFERVGCG